MEEYLKQLQNQIQKVQDDAINSLNAELVKQMDKATLKSFNRNKLFELIDNFLDTANYKGQTDEDIEVIKTLSKILNVLIDEYESK